MVLCKCRALQRAVPPEAGVRSLVAHSSSSVRSASELSLLAHTPARKDILRKLSSMGYQAKTQLSAFYSSDSIEHLPGSYGQDLANVSWAFAKLGIQNDELFEEQIPLEHVSLTRVASGYLVGTLPELAGAAQLASCHVLIPHTPEALAEEVTRQLPQPLGPRLLKQRSAPIPTPSPSPHYTCSLQIRVSGL